MQKLKLSGMYLHIDKPVVYGGVSCIGHGKVPRRVQPYSACRVTPDSLPASVRARITG